MFTDILYKISVPVNIGGTEQLEKISLFTGAHEPAGQHNVGVLQNQQRLTPGRSMAAEAPPSPPKPPADADDQGPLQSEDGGAKAGDGQTRTSGGGEW